MVTIKEKNDFQSFRIFTDENVQKNNKTGYNKTIINRNYMEDTSVKSIFNSVGL